MCACRVPQAAKERRTRTHGGHAMQTDTTRLRELTVRYSVRKNGEGQPLTMGRLLSNPTDAASVLMELLQDEPAEVFAILCLTTKLRVIAYHEVSRGTLDSTSAHPREVFRAAILANALR